MMGRLRPAPPGRAHARWAGRTRMAAAPCSCCPHGTGCAGRSRPCRGTRGPRGRRIGWKAVPAGQKEEGQLRAAWLQSCQETLTLCGPGATGEGRHLGLAGCAVPGKSLHLSETQLLSLGRAHSTSLPGPFRVQVVGGWGEGTLSWWAKPEGGAMWPGGGARVGSVTPSVPWAGTGC